MPTVAIISTKNDLHPYAVQQMLREKGARSFIVHSDSVAHRTFNWKFSNLSSDCRLQSIDGEIVDPRSVDVVWWRRAGAKQLTELDFNSPESALLDRDCSASLFGAWSTQFRGIWVNDPFLTERADNKLLQLQIASEVGLPVPQTLVSNVPEEVKQFCESLDFNVIAKPVRGTTQKMLFTQTVTEKDLLDAESIKACPTMFQEKIEGRKHIRSHCFGEKVISVLVESENLDWRVDLDRPFSFFRLDSSIEAKILKVVEALGLRMGMVDLKIDDSGTPIWLEINAQGQFLFCEGLTDLELRAAFSDFLLDCCKQKVSA